MYHLCNDKRAERSAQLIYDGLMALLKEKPFDQITQSDIQQTTGVARTTIRRNFDSLIDVLYWRCDCCFRRAMRVGEEIETPDENELIRHFFAYWMENSDILALLMKLNRPELIYACHLENAKKLAQKFGELPNMTETEAHYFLAIRTGITIAVLRVWLDGGRKETPEELLNLVRAQMTR